MEDTSEGTHTLREQIAERRLRTKRTSASDDGEDGSSVDEDELFDELEREMDDERLGVMGRLREERMAELKRQYVFDSLT